MKNIVFIACLYFSLTIADLNELEQGKTGKQTSIVLGYKPIRPFYKPGPVNYPTEIMRPQIRPTETFIQPSSTYETTHTSAIYRPPVSIIEPSTFLVPPFFNQTSVSTIQTASNSYYTSSTIYPSSVSLTTSTSIYQPSTKPPYLYEEETLSTTTTERLPPSYVLGYKPMRPPYKPSPVNYPTEIIRPQTRTTATEHSTSFLDHSSQINQQPSVNPAVINTIHPSSVSVSSITTSSLKPPTSSYEEYPTTEKRPPSIVLEYQPIYPFYRPGPVNYPTEIIRPQIRPTTVTTQIHTPTKNPDSFLQPDSFTSSTINLIRPSLTSRPSTETSVVNGTYHVSNPINHFSTDEILVPTTSTETLPLNATLSYKPTSLPLNPDPIFHPTEVKPIHITNTSPFSSIDSSLDENVSTSLEENSSISTQSTLIPIKSPNNFDDLSTEATEHLSSHPVPNYKPEEKKTAPNRISLEIFDDIFSENIPNIKNSKNATKESLITIDLFDYAPTTTQSHISVSPSTSLISSTEPQIIKIKPAQNIDQQKNKMDIF